jgi:hypothetical protein
MGCGCNKKKGTSYHIGQNTNEQGNPEKWGPILWKYLHCAAEKIGTTGNPNVDTDQARLFEYMLKNLADVIPCTECQAHCKEYITANPVPTLVGLLGDNLKNAARTWLFTFHNAVRARKGQSILIINENDCKQYYANCFVPRMEYNIFAENVIYAVRQGWVKIDNWRKWYINSEKLRVMLGSLVV